ncbi:MAG: hypothetical protein GXO10_04975 [Crenarchaeota archaeon]|nr:hypothetical protein [Thermoproteota archaeon]
MVHFIELFKLFTIQWTQFTTKYLPYEFVLYIVVFAAINIMRMEPVTSMLGTILKLVFATLVEAAYALVVTIVGVIILVWCSIPLVMVVTIVSVTLLW